MKHSTYSVIVKKERAEAVRTAQYGSPPINPFKLLRTTHGFTHNDLCSQVYISKQALIRLEQGTYTNPLPSVLTWWAEHSCHASNCPAQQPEQWNLFRAGEPIGELYLRELYSEFQQDQRKRYTKLFGSSLVFNDNELARVHEQRYHPFRILRDRISFSLTEVARSLCLPQATLEHFEKKYRTQQSVPKELRNVLREIGYETDERNWFADQYMQFRSGSKRYTITSVGSTSNIISEVG